MPAAGDQPDFVSEFIWFMRFSFRNALRERFVQAVNLIFVLFLLIDCPFAEFQPLFVFCFLPFRHPAFQFPQLRIGNRFQPLFRFLCRFRPLRMLAVVRLTKQFFALFFVFATLTDSFFFSYLITFVDHFPAHLRIGRKGRKIALNGCVRQHKFRLFNCVFAVKMHAVCKNLLKTRFADSFAK
ncbi:MAG: hypothetical protein LBP64_01685, partial [Tannerella sp.]|nr:hypothetical protein [Tannerella sp.]